jgi:NAD(P)-dependent dehydrogenase (short-subunit alcohol dehydrogenase family)
MLKDKVVVITGGAGLLGAEFVRSIAQNDGIPIIGEINCEAGEKTKLSINTELRTDRVDFFPLDITSKESVNELIDYVSSKYNKVDALVNNAYPRNKNYGRHFFNVKFEDFIDNLGMNLGGYFLTSQQFSKYFYKQGYGNIVNISSIYGVVAPRFEIYEGTEMTSPVEYAAIKSGLIHLTKYMAKYFKGKNIRVNSISIGGIIDKQPESFLKEYKKFCLNKGMLNTEDIIGSLIFLLSDTSKFFNGQNLVVDDGFTL